jgi:hypothetical protein
VFCAILRVVLVVRWSSGLRRWIKVPILPRAWVQTPLSSLFPLSLIFSWPISKGLIYPLEDKFSYMRPVVLSFAVHRQNEAERCGELWRFDNEFQTFALRRSMSRNFGREPNSNAEALIAWLNNQVASGSGPF